MLPNKAPGAFYASADFFRYTSLKVYVAGSHYWSVGATGGYRWDIPAGNFGIMPYLRVGFDYQHDQEYEDFKKANFPAIFPAVSLMGQAGLKITTSFVPGLFLGAAFQYNVFDLSTFGFMKFDNPMKMGIAFTAGYIF